MFPVLRSSTSLPWSCRRARRILLAAGSSGLLFAFGLATALLTEPAYAEPPRDRPTEPGTMTPAFAIPTSGLVFEARVTIPGGGPVHLETREGALVFIELPGGGRVGLVLTLDRARLEQDGPRVVWIQSYAIDPHPEGGESMRLVGIEEARYWPEATRVDEDLPADPALVDASAGVKVRGITLQVELRDDHFQSFQDGPLVTLLWEAVYQDKRALDGLEDLLYSLYGPIASECEICYGALVCATAVNCDEPGGGGLAE